MARFLPIAFLLAGCTVTGPAPVTTTDGPRTGIVQRANDTKQAADNWQAVAPSPEHHALIQSYQNEIIRLTSDIAAADKAAQATIKRLSDEQAKRDRGFFLLMILAGVVALAAGIAIAVVGAKLLGLAIAAGGGVAVGCAVILPPVIQSAFALVWVAAGVGGGLLILCGVIAGWTLWSKYVEDKSEAKRAADILRDVRDGRTPLDAAIASLRTLWRQFDLAWGGA